MKEGHFIKALLLIGFVARNRNGGIDWPFYITPKHNRNWRHLRANWRIGNRFYVFRNLPGVIKWDDNRLLPRRWGFGILGFIEFGDRGH